MKMISIGNPNLGYTSIATTWFEISSILESRPVGDNQFPFFSKMVPLKFLIFLIFCNCLVLSFPLKNTYRHSKKLKRTLRVSALQNEPFINRNSYGDLNKGIEMELIKTIAEKENLKLLIQNRSQ